MRTVSGQALCLFLKERGLSEVYHTSLDLFTCISGRHYNIDYDIELM